MPHTRTTRLSINNKSNNNDDDDNNVDHDYDDDYVDNNHDYVADDVDRDGDDNEMCTRICATAKLKLLQNDKTRARKNKKSMSPRIDQSFLFFFFCNKY